MTKSEQIDTIANAIEQGRRIGASDRDVASNVLDHLRGGNERSECVKAEQLPRVVRTVEELDALPVGMGVRDSMHNVFHRAGDWEEGQEPRMAGMTENGADK